MEVFAPYGNYVLIFSGVYLLIVLLLFIKSSRFKRDGVCTKATILSIDIIEVDGGLDSDSSLRYEGLIEFKTTKGELINAKIPVARRYLADKYKEALPIIYNKKRVDKPIINDDLYIYQYPIVLLLIFIVFGITLFCILLSSGK